MSAIPIVVFDCTTFAQALSSINGPAGLCVRAAQRGKLSLFVSDYVLQEIRGLPSKLPSRLQVTQERTDRFISDLAKYSHLLENVPQVFSYDRDQDDAPYIDLAVAAGAPIFGFARQGPAGSDASVEPYCFIGWVRC